MPAGMASGGVRVNWLSRGRFEGFANLHKSFKKKLASMDWRLALRFPLLRDLRLRRPLHRKFEMNGSQLNCNAKAGNSRLPNGSL